VRQQGKTKTPPLGGGGEKSLYLWQKMMLFIDDKEAPAE